MLVFGRKPYGNFQTNVYSVDNSIYLLWGRDNLCTGSADINFNNYAKSNWDSIINGFSNRDALIGDIHSYRQRGMLATVQHICLSSTHNYDLTPDDTPFSLGD
jgi:hypothetical protein